MPASANPQHRRPRASVTPHTQGGRCLDATIVGPEGSLRRPIGSQPGGGEEEEARGGEDGGGERRRRRGERRSEIARSSSETLGQRLVGRFTRKAHHHPSTDSAVGHHNGPPVGGDYLPHDGKPEPGAPRRSAPLPGLPARSARRRVLAPPPVSPAHHRPPLLPPRHRPE